MAVLLYQDFVLLEMKSPIGTIKPRVNFDTPIFQGHGTVDPVINYDYGKQTSELYKQLGFKNLKFNTYEGVAHSASEEELADVIKFIKNIVEK